MVKNRNAKSYILLFEFFFIRYFTCDVEVEGCSEIYALRL